MALITRPIDHTITPSDPAYTAGDTLGGLITLEMHTNTGLIMGATVACGQASISVAGTLYFYNDAPTSFNDNEAWLPEHTDNEKCIGKILLPSPVLMNTRNVYLAKNNQAAQDGVFEYSTKKLYCYYVLSATPNFADALQDVNLKIHALGEQ